MNVLDVKALVSKSRLLISSSNNQYASRGQWNPCQDLKEHV